MPFNDEFRLEANDDELSIGSEDEGSCDLSLSADDDNDDDEEEEEEEVVEEKDYTDSKCVQTNGHVEISKRKRTDIFQFGREQSKRAKLVS